MKLFNKLFPVIVLAVMTGCASINNPEGGPKDETPPKLLSSNPKNQQLNVKTNVITLEFDEEVQQNNLNKELVITPNLENKYRVKTDKNHLQLIFEKPLQDSTTYILNFRKGIQDITEKNIAPELKLAFSTGSFIDSSRVGGTVLDLLTNEPVKEAIVALYQANDTLSIRKNKPFYQIVTDATGKFEFTNLKEGPYRVFALKDLNNNSLYDNENEMIGYVPGQIIINPQEQQLEINTAKIDTKPPILLKKDRYADRFSGTYNEGLIKITVLKLDAPKDTLSYVTSADTKTVELFKTQNFKGGNILFSAIDSSGNTALDTIKVEFTDRYQQTIRGARLKVFNNNKENSTYSTGQKLTIEFQTPIRIIGKTPLQIISDSLSRLTLKNPEDIRLDRTATELSFTIPLLKTRAESYSISLDSTQIIPLEGPRFSLPKLQFQVSDKKGTGSVSGKVKTKHKSFTIQLLDNNNQVVDEVMNKTTFNFRNKEAGTYHIRILIDENNNGKWDGPDPTFKNKPERIYFYPKPITIRANWMIEDETIEITD